MGYPNSLSHGMAWHQGCFGWALGEAGVGVLYPPLPFRTHYQSVLGSCLLYGTGEDLLFGCRDIFDLQWGHHTYRTRLCAPCMTGAAYIYVYRACVYGRLSHLVFGAETT